MRTYHRLFYTLLLLLLYSTTYATWSIIIIDPKTKQIGIAGASCTYSVYGIGGIVPGKGAIVVQAMSNKMAKMEGLKMILAGASPQQVLTALQDPDFEPEEQQYGIATLNYLDSSSTYTGTLNPASKGALIAKGISIQGNTLSNDMVLQSVLEAALKAQRASLPLEEILMQALEAGAKAGGDRRCGTRTASSAFITIAKATDDYNHPYLNVVVKDSGDDSNAVETLRKRLTDWKRRQDD